MELSNTSNTITIANGKMIIKGREFAVVGGGETINVEATPSGSLYGALVVEIDLTKESTKSNFEQVSFKVLQSATDYPKSTQQDINSGETAQFLYQVELAKFKITTSGISEFIDTRTFLKISSLYNLIENKLKEIEGNSILGNYMDKLSYTGTVLRKRNKCI